MGFSNIIRGLKAYVLDRYFIKQPRLRQWVTRALYGSEDQEVSLFGTRLTINALRENGYLRAEKIVRHSCLWRDETATLMALCHVLRPGDTFVDVGANVGVFCCTLARLPGVKVVAFEANQETFKRLKINADRHGVEALCVAVSDKVETLEFYDGAVSHVFAAAAHKNAYHTGQTVKVQARPLSELVVTDGPLVLKIDVEGHEPEVLQGAAALIDAGRIKAVVLDASREARTAAQWLQSKGYQIVDPVTFVAPTATTGVFLALRS